MKGVKGLGGLTSPPSPPPSTRRRQRRRREGRASSERINSIACARHERRSEALESEVSWVASSVSSASSSSFDANQDANESEQVRFPFTLSCSSSRSLKKWSVVIPTYNRLGILKKCLAALEKQELEGSGIEAYEVVVVDDESEDDTVKHIEEEDVYSKVKLVKAEHGGAAAARNVGIRASRGGVIVFIDSDMVVTQTFLKSHARKLYDSFKRHGDCLSFTYGAVINTNNFDSPESEPHKVSDYSAAFFATGNVAIAYDTLMGTNTKAERDVDRDGDDGPFDVNFSTYGWEDLELGERLRGIGSRLVHAPEAVGYHWHPPFKMEDLGALVEREMQRGANGIKFFMKHPNLRVRLMIQYTPIHFVLWWLLTLGGLLSAKRMSRVFGLLCKKGFHRAATLLLVPILNWECVKATFKAARESGV